MSLTKQLSDFLGRESNPRSSDHGSDALTIRPSKQPHTTFSFHATYLIFISYSLPVPFTTLPSSLSRRCYAILLLISSNLSQSSLYTYIPHFPHSLPKVCHISSLSTMRMSFRPASWRIAVSGCCLCSLASSPESGCSPSSWPSDTSRSHWQLSSWQQSRPYH